MKKPLRLTVESETVDRLVRLASALEAFSDVGPSIIELRELVRRFPQGPAALNLYFALAGIAGDERVTLEPCDFEIHLMTAMRALNAGKPWSGALKFSCDLQFMPRAANSPSNCG